MRGTNAGHTRQQRAQPRKEDKHLQFASLRGFLAGVTMPFSPSDWLDCNEMVVPILTPESGTETLEMDF